MLPSTSHTTLLTPIGPMVIEATHEVLTSIRVLGRKTTTETVLPGTAILREAAAQLEAWFAHRIERFDLPLMAPKTPRAAEMREAICRIPYGDTASYGAVARAIGSGPRAIGQACRRNPFMIVVPCHRVTAAAQMIGYYSGGDGVETKKWLLDHELNH